MSRIDDLPYAVVGAAIATVGFLFGNLILYQHTWQLVLAPFAGAILGFVVGVVVLRKRKLPALATWRQFREVINREGKAN